MPKFYPAPGAPAVSPLTCCDVNIFNGNSPIAFTELDLSGTVGANCALVYFTVYTEGGAADFHFKPHGDAPEDQEDGVSFAHITGVGLAHLLLLTDASGKVSWKASAAIATHLYIRSYIK